MTYDLDLHKPIYAKCYYGDDLKLCQDELVVQHAKYLGQK